MTTKGWGRPAMVLVMGVLAVGACDFGEDRPFNYEKGVYLGEPHEPLDEEALAALRARAALQSDLGVASGGGSPARLPPPETGPSTTRHRTAFGAGGDGGATQPTAAAPPPSAQALRRRAARQGGL